MKTSLDAKDSIESIWNDKSMPLHLTFLRKIHVCEVAVLKFSKIRENEKERTPHPV